MRLFFACSDRDHGHVCGWTFAKNILYKNTVVSMVTMLHIVEEGSACAGSQLLIAAGASMARHGRELEKSSVEIELAALLGEYDARGIDVPVVSLWVNSAVDALSIAQGGWLEWAMRWLEGHGRAVIVRTRHILARSIIDCAVEVDAGIELEIAHQQPIVQKALLGAAADSAAALLLQAQHLVSCELAVWVRLAPLFPGVHDEPRVFTSLVKNIVAADLRSAHLEIGSLLPRQRRALQASVRQGGVSPGGLLKLGRAFGLDPVALLGGYGAEQEPKQRHESARSLRVYRKTALEHGLKRISESVGLQVDHCGCAFQCHLRVGEAKTRPYVSVVGPELFAQELTA